MRKVTALLLAALVLVGANTALADKTITLDKDTKLVPQGWTVADDIKFKKNTVVKLNDDGQVIEGVLASATYLRPAGWKSLASNYYYVERSAPFFPPRFFYHPYRPGLVIPSDGHVRYMGNKSVTFAKDGTVLSGVIDNDVILQLSDNGYGFVRFKNDNLLTFDADGRVISGTLAEATKLRPLGWQHNLQDESAGFVLVGIVSGQIAVAGDVQHPVKSGAGIVRPHFPGIAGADNRFVRNFIKCSRPESPIVPHQKQAP